MSFYVYHVVIITLGKNVLYSGLWKKPITSDGLDRRGFLGVRTEHQTVCNYSMTSLCVGGKDIRDSVTPFEVLFTFRPVMPPHNNTPCNDWLLVRRYAFGFIEVSSSTGCTYTDSIDLGLLATNHLPITYQNPT